MWSGGITTNKIETADDAASARDELTALNEQLSDQTVDAREEGQKVQDARDELSDARNDKARAQNEEAYRRGQARSKAEGAKQAANYADQYRHSQEGKLKEIAVEGRRVNSLWQQASDQRWLHLKQQWMLIEDGYQKLFSELQNNDGEIWRLIHAAISKMGRAMIADLVGPLSASVALNLYRYFEPLTPQPDPSEHTFANAEAARKTFEAQKQKAEEDAADPYYADEAGRKSAEAKAAKEKHDAAQADLTAKRSAERAADVAMDAAVETSNAASDEANETKREMGAVETELQKYNDKIRSKQLEAQQKQAAQQGGQARRTPPAGQRPATPAQPAPPGGQPQPPANQPPAGQPKTPGEPFKEDLRKRMTGG